LQQLVGKLPSLYQDETQLRKLRANPDTRKELLTKLEHMGISDDQLNALRAMFEAPESDIFDILAHLSFASQMKTRHERAIRVRDHKIIFDSAPNIEAREFLEFVLSYYEDHGSTELIRDKIGDIIDLYGKGTTPDMIKVFGGNSQFLESWYAMQEELFSI
jgi:type I restriction enzyme R subunit